MNFIDSQTYFTDILNEEVLFKWRDGANGLWDKIGRRVVCGAALLGLSMLRLIEATAYLALGLFTSPLLFFNISFPYLFIVKALAPGFLGAAFYLTIGEIVNIFSEKMAKN